MGLYGVVPVDLPAREPLEYLLEGDAALEPGERGAEAEVDAVAEGEVLLDVAVDVELVRPSAEARSSRSAEPVSRHMTLPAGTFLPYHSTSCAM